jgi:hypothetical protein
VAVSVQTTGDPAPRLGRCLSEAGWDLILPTPFHEEWTTWNISV